MDSRPILVGYDGSAGARAAARWAFDEGARTGQPVRLAYAFDWVNGAAWIPPAPAVWPDELARRDAQAVVDAAVTDAAPAHPGLEVTGVVLDGPAAVRLQEQSRHAAALVLGSRGHGGFGELLVGSTAVSLAAHAHCPVIVVRGRQPRPDQAPGPVVVGVDGSPGSELALGYAFERAADRGVPLRAVRTWMPPAHQWGPRDVDPAKITSAERSALDLALAPWREKYPDVPVTGEVAAGSAARLLVDASRDAQLAVVGSRGRGGFRGLLLGSVSQQLLHHSYCPVAVIRELPAHQPAATA